MGTPVNATAANRGVDASGLVLSASLILVEIHFRCPFSPSHRLRSRACGVPVLPRGRAFRGNHKPRPGQWGGGVDGGELTSCDPAADPVRPHPVAATEFGYGNSGGPRGLNLT